MSDKKIFCGFRKRSLPIIADYRPLYKIGLITLILKLVCNGNKASLNKLHFFVWALKSERNINQIRRLISKDENYSMLSWGVEPALNKALGFGVAEGLFGLKGDKYTLSSSGLLFYEKIKTDKELFVIEIDFLSEIGKRSVNEDFIKNLTLNL